MDLLLILTYTAICIVIFKVFKVPLTKWTVPTAVLGGVFLIGGLIFIMNYNHPYSEVSREYFVTTPVVPTVTGQVIEVPVKGNTILEQGDVLFKIDPTRFQAVVNAKRAALAGASKDVGGLGAAWEAAQAAALKSQVDRDRTKQTYDRYRRGSVGPNSPFSAQEVENRKQLYLASEATLESMQAKEKQARLAFESNIDGTNPKVAQLQAELEKALYDLDQTVVRAPTRGYVTQVALRPGMMAASLPLRPVMVFVHDEGNYYVAWFRQNSMLRLQQGDEAEVAFDGIPGQVFAGKVSMVLPAMSEGQVLPTGNLINPQQAIRPGRIPVLIDITDSEFEQYVDKVPGGAYAQTAIYTEHFHHVAIMRKVLLRMSAWMNYLFPFH